MLDYQVISDETGRVLAVLSYATLAFGQETARTYERVLGLPCYRNTMRTRTPPAVGATLPELVRGSEGASLKLALERALGERVR